MFKSLAHDVECCLSVCFLSHFKFRPLMAIEQWRFFNVQHLLWNVPIIYYCHLRWPVALKPVAEPRSPARKAIALPLRHRGWWRQMLYIIESLVHFTCNKCFKCTYIKLILEKGRHSNKLKYRGKIEKIGTISFYIVYTNFRIFIKNPIASLTCTVQ